MTCQYCNQICQKAGKQKNGAQKLYCKPCEKYQQAVYRKNACKAKINPVIAQLVCESIGIRGIARILKIAANTVLNRIRTIADSIPKPNHNKMRIMFRIYLIACMQMLSSCYSKAEPETYLIPSSFSGKVNILFNQNGIPVKYKNEYGKDTIYVPQIGKPIKYEDGRRVYEIPSSGILLSQFKNNDGFINRKYFLVDSNGKRISLEIFELEHYKRDSTRWVVNDKNEKGIFGDGTSGSYRNMNIPYQDFTVSSYNGLDSFYTKEHQNNFNDRIEKITGLTLRLK
ncbi:MAG TPA: hypothetical protein VK563_00210 [Puia sp.]|nr:hypothetical protein [Puia sp.]